MTFPCLSLPDPLLAPQDEVAGGQESLWRHRSKVLKSLGMHLQYQARLLEREARMLEQEAHAQYSRTEVEPGLGEGYDQQHFYVAADSGDTRARAPPAPPPHNLAENMPRMLLSLPNVPMY